LPLIRKGRISHVPSEFSTKKNTFGVPFEGWKICEMNQGSESKRQHIGIFTALIGEFCFANRQGLFSEPALGLVSIH